MTHTRARKLRLAFLALLLAGAAAFAQPATPNTDAPATNAPPKILVFRNVPSWNRSPDFEDTLADLGLDFEVKPSSLMGTADLSPYAFIIIPGAQWRTDFYPTYAANAERFDRYVTNGGILVLELNGAENDGLPLPRGVNVVRHPGVDNAILWPDHPILAPLHGKMIHANLASHCYLNGLPKDALILAAESTGGQTDTNKPTFIEYASGQGRVIAACQCFHDQDRSGRGPLMRTTLAYAAGRKWFMPKK